MNKLIIPSQDYMNLSSGEEIQMAVAPLFKNTLIDYFAYMRYYKTGEIVEICTDSHFVHKQHVGGCALDPTELARVINSYKTTQYISSFYTNYLPLPKVLKNHNMHHDNIVLSDALGIKNRYYIFKDFGDYIELIGFASSQIQFSIEEYINNKELLEKFVFYFKTKMCDLIKKLKSLSKGENFLSNYRHPQNSQQHFCSDKLLNDIKLSRIPIEGAYLTAQELKIIIHYANGSSAKLIAKTFGISPRTVETHIRNANLKLNFGFRSKLLSTLSSNGIGKSILELL